MCEVITRTYTNDGLLDECFSPRYRIRQKREGEWLDGERLLLPGYVVAVTQQPEALARALRSIPEFTRVLTMGETFVPLNTDEQAWIDRWTKEGDRTIPLSVAYKKGDTLVVTEGPLKGNEGMITRVNRRKCLAFLELQVGDKRVVTTVGLAIVPSEEGTAEDGTGVGYDVPSEGFE